MLVWLSKKDQVAWFHAAHITDASAGLLEDLIKNKRKQEKH